MSLTKQLKALGEGETLTLETDQQKAVYVTASRLKMKVTTERKDDKLLVTRTSKSAPTITTKEVTILDRVKALSVTDRKTLFDAFELCCAMNRGACICPPEEIEIAPPSPVHHVVETPAGMNSAMARFLESQAVQIAEAEPIDEWAGWSEERQAPDEQAGEIVTYRQHIKKGTRKEIRRESAW